MIELVVVVKLVILSLMNSMSSVIGLVAEINISESEINAISVCIP